MSFSVGIFLAAACLLLSDNVSALDQNNCLGCHGQPQVTTTTPDGRKVSLYVNDKLVNTAAHRFIDCMVCHPNTHQSQSALNKQTLAQKCGSCHAYEYKLHLDSVHGQQLARGNQDVATCVDCHSAEGNPHSVIRVLEYKATTYKKNIADTCGNCHGSQKLMASYGRVERVYESYMRNFHGKALELNDPQIATLGTATCTNCHGVHDIKRTRDSSSPVSSLSNLAKVCNECHPDVGVNFASSFIGHKEATSEYVAPVYYTELGFKIFLFTVVGLGVVILVGGIVGMSSKRWRN
jgi:nitrate/TMAO reductase-like tetraheme cytochrome c subunit